MGLRGQLSNQLEARRLVGCSIRAQVNDSLYKNTMVCVKLNSEVLVLIWRLSIRKHKAPLPA